MDAATSTRNGASEVCLTQSQHSRGEIPFQANSRTLYRSRCRSDIFGHLRFHRTCESISTDISSHKWLPKPFLLRPKCSFDFLTLWVLGNFCGTAATCRGMFPEKNKKPASKHVRFQDFCHLMKCRAIKFTLGCLVYWGTGSLRRNPYGVFDPHQQTKEP